MEVLIVTGALVAIGAIVMWLNRAPQLNRVLAEHERDEAARAEQQDSSDEGAA